MGYQNFYATRLFTDIGSSDVTITVEVPPTETAGRLVLEARNPTQREIISFTGVSGSQITGVTRGIGGTTAKAHIKGSLVEMNLTAEDIEDALGVPSDIVTRFDENLADFVQSGCVWSQVSLLAGTMTAGVIYIGGNRVVISAIASNSFTASKDTYVDIDVSGTVYYTPVANGATTGFPLTAGRIRLAKVVTNTTTITSVTTTGVDGIANLIRPLGSVRDSNINATVSFLVRRTTDQTIATSSITKVQAATKIFDIGNNFDNVTNYVFTAPYAGIYHFEAEVSIDATGAQCLAYIYHNGAQVAVDNRYNAAATDDLSANVSITLLLATGDTVDFRAQHNAGSNRQLLGSISNSNYFSGFLVGRV